MNRGDGERDPSVSPLKVHTETPQSWRSAVEFAIDDGWTFASLHASVADHVPAVTVVFVRGSRRLAYVCPTSDASVPTIVDLAPAAVWDEREAHDIYGWQFSGHDPLRPMLDHECASQDWTTDVSAEDLYQVAVGPVHAGVIESGHFRFHVAGEQVIHVDLQLFHKHRGLEHAAEGAAFANGMAFVQRACGADAVSNSAAYVEACERALGLAPPEGLRRSRTILLELERLYNHLNDISAIYAGVGFAPGTMIFASLKERALRLNRQLTGHRFLFNTIGLATHGFEITAVAASSARAELAQIGTEFQQVWRGAQFAGSAQDRFEDVGVISRTDALALGAVGPAARAAGIDRDVRVESPRLAYHEFEPARPFDGRGDVRSRFELRGTEIEQSLAILDELLGGPITTDVVDDGLTPDHIGVGIVESPRGRTICVVEAQDGKIRRLHLRTGSYANWPTVAHAARGNLIADFPLINKSFELCYACVDR